MAACARSRLVVELVDRYATAASDWRIILKLLCGFLHATFRVRACLNGLSSSAHSKLDTAIAGPHQAARRIMMSVGVTSPTGSIWLRPPTAPNKAGKRRSSTLQRLGREHVVVAGGERALNVGASCSAAACVGPAAPADGTGVGAAGLGGARLFAVAALRTTINLFSLLHHLVAPQLELAVGERIRRS